MLGTLLRKIANLPDLDGPVARRLQVVWRLTLLSGSSPGFRAMILVTILVTVRTHTNTHHPAKGRNEAHECAS
jgi:hypothetical protein